MENNTHTVFNAAQLKMLNMMAMLKTKDEIDRLWEEGELSEEKVEGFRTLHERTHYNKQQL